MHLEAYMSDITDATFQYMDQGADLVKAQAIEVWSSIGEEEAELENEGTRHLGIIQKIFRDLLS